MMVNVQKTEVIMLKYNGANSTAPPISTVSAQVRSKKGTIVATIGRGGTFMAAEGVVDAILPITTTTIPTAIQVT